MNKTHRSGMMPWNARFIGMHHYARLFRLEPAPHRSSCRCPCACPYACLWKHPCAAYAYACRTTHAHVLSQLVLDTAVPSHRHTIFLPQHVNAAASDRYNMRTYAAHAPRLYRHKHAPQRMPHLCCTYPVVSCRGMSAPRRSPRLHLSSSVASPAALLAVDTPIIRYAPAELCDVM